MFFERKGQAFMMNSGEKVNSKGKLIVIEGTDGSGKATQSALLVKHLKAQGYDVRELSFPCYGKPSCALVEMYLGGEFGDKPDSVNCYAASTFYAVDRYASYKKDWESFYENGGILVANRYVTSNLVHQMTKLPQREWSYFCQWLRDLEYEKFGIPKPDKVIFLHMPVEVSQKLMTHRYDGDESKKDIHEKDVEYLARCHQAAAYAVETDGWETLQCSKDGQPLSIEAIGEQVLERVKECL
jgi:dTMP kinase